MLAITPNVHTMNPEPYGVSLPFRDYISLAATFSPTSFLNTFEMPS